MSLWATIMFSFSDGVIFTAIKGVFLFLMSMYYSLDSDTLCEHNISMLIVYCYRYITLKWPANNFYYVEKNNVSDYGPIDIIVLLHRGIYFVISP